MKRILVIGSGGSGKSTFARALGQRLQRPVTHLDALYWKPGWVASSAETFDAALHRIISTPQWILDGNYSRTLPIRLAAADTIFFLDFPRALCTYRVLKRVATSWGRTRPDMAPGCPEHFSFEFLQWVWTYPTRIRPKVLAQLQSLRPDQHTVTFTSPAQLRDFLSQIPTAPTADSRT